MWWPAPETLFGALPCCVNERRLARRSHTIPQDDTQLLVGVSQALMDLVQGRNLGTVYLTE